jgi:hypothetical protein
MAAITFANLAAHLPPLAGAMRAAHLDHKACGRSVEVDDAAG